MMDGGARRMTWTKKESRGWLGKSMKMLGLSKSEAEGEEGVGPQVQVDIPQHVLMQQRRRQRIAEERRRQLAK